MRAHLEPKPDCLVRVERSKELILELGISVGDSCQASGYSINSKGQNGIENLGITYYVICPFKKWLYLRVILMGQ